MRKYGCMSFSWVVAMCALILGACYSDGHAQPRAKVDKVTVDIGTVLEGQDASHGFLITNEGDAPLVIKPRPC
ncbi:MAG TPA: hypothetical protein PLS81_02205 [Deltaproteobacteria bacterium]|nr:hypothetical protein [Deltaproteobacteria bacterium]HOM28255.1 hypothetical protein [Deltaproteobacteria bacterium]HPP79486.1 hypothetical protein [Deltaproteobacteria bacterium]